MSSKLKSRLTNVNAENKRIKNEWQRAIRALTACCLKYGKIEIDFTTAAKIEDGHQVSITQDRRTGAYTIQLLEKKNADQLGSSGDGERVQQRSGDVEISISEDVDEPASGEVSQGDQYDPGEAGLSSDSEEAPRGSEQHEG